MRSVDGPENTFKNPDGSERTSRFDPNRVTC
jgi:hypothetical protein